MKSLFKYYMKTAGYVDRAKYIEKQTGVNPIMFDAITYKNAAEWFAHTLLWMSFLESEYFLKRLIFIREKNPKYRPDMISFLPLFHEDVDSTVDLLIKLDDVCLKVTDHPFPDSLLQTTIPPMGGPYYDLLIALKELGSTVPIDLLHPTILGLGLQFGSTPKTILDLELITKRDIIFLANFVTDLANKAELSKKLIALQDDEDAFLIFMMVIAPEKTKTKLEYNDEMVKEGLEALSKAVTEYEKDPKQLKSTLLDNL